MDLKIIWSSVSDIYNNLAGKGTVSLTSMVQGKQVLPTSVGQQLAIQQAGSGQQVKITLPLQANQTVC